jgi:hypothetical protein
MAFARGVVDYDVLPDRLSVVFGLLLIPLETGLAFSHLTGWWISIGAAAGLTMFASFAVAVAINLARGRSLPCFCFGDGEGETISWSALVRLLLLLGGEALLLASPGQPGISRLISHQLTALPELGFALFWTALLVVAAMWLLGLADLVELLRPLPSLAGQEPHGRSLAAAGGQQ